MGRSFERERIMGANERLQGWLLLVMNWTALIFGSTTNFVAPLMLYIRSKTYPASTADTAGLLPLPNSLVPRQSNWSSIGGDNFVLHRPSTDSGRRASHEPHANNIPTINLSESTPPSTPNAIEETPSSPFLIVNRPPSISEENTGLDPDPDPSVSENANEASGSNLDPTALRVVYSPAVSRSGSISRSHAERPSITLTPEGNNESEPEVDKQTIKVDTSSARLQASSIDVSPHSPTSSILNRRRSTSINSQTFTNTSLQSPRRERTLSFEERGAIPRGVVFKAFPDKNWWNSIVVAKIALGVVSVAVLGNLIYSIVETAKGNSPLS
jgi:hypothetical protein